MFAMLIICLDLFPIKGNVWQIDLQSSLSKSYDGLELLFRLSRDIVDSLSFVEFERLIKRFTCKASKQSFELIL